MCILLKLHYAKVDVSRFFCSNVIDEKPLGGGSDPPLVKEGLMSNLHFYDLHTSSLVYFLSNIYKWTLTLLTVESSWVVFAIYFMRSAGLLCPD